MRNINDIEARSEFRPWTRNIFPKVHDPRPELSESRKAEIALGAAKAAFYDIPGIEDLVIQ